MSRSLAIALVMPVLTGGCVIDAEHVSTRVVSVCTDDVPIVFVPQSATRSASGVRVDDVDVSVEDPDARITLGDILLTADQGIEDFSFAESLQVVVVAPQEDLPDAAVIAAVVTGEASVEASGDPSVNLLEYLSDDSMWFRIELAGAPPDHEFGVTLGACLDLDGFEVEGEDE